MTAIRIKITLCLIFLFITGIVVGSVGTVYYARNNEGDLFGTKGPLIARSIILNRLNRKLDLDTEQQKKIEEIVREAQSEIAGHRLAVLDQLTITARKAFDETSKVLNPKQLPKLEQFRDRVEKRLARLKGVIRNKQIDLALPGTVESNANQMDTEK